MVESLTYSLARVDVLDGDVVFISGTSLMSKVIRVVTRSKYSHVGIAFWCTIGNVPRLMMIESQSEAARRIVNLSFYSDKDFDVVSAPLDWSLVVDEAVSRVAKEPYGNLQAVYVGLREFLMNYINFKYLPEVNIYGEICSEFVANTYNLQRQTISPELLFEELGGESAIRLRVRRQ